MFVLRKPTLLLNSIIRVQLKMNRQLNLAKLATRTNSKPKKNETKTIAAIASEAKEQTESPYFSPVKTRNQRKHIKIEFDEIEKKSSTDQEKQVISKKETDKKKPVVDKKSPKKRNSGSLKAAAPSTSTNTESIKSEIKEKKPKWEPENWQQSLANMREMRKDRSAPVDTMGCHKCSDDAADDKTKRFHNLIALMLSSQTKDQVTFEAMTRLKQNGLTPKQMIEIDTVELERLLYPVSFYKTKAKHIQKTANILFDSFDSDIPNSVEGLVKLPGVGPKMAHICMRTAWNVISGIGVDTHVHRISNRLKWLPKQTKEPEQTRVELEKWLPFENWSEVNELMVGFGQTICTPTNPKCDSCLNSEICPSKVIKKKK